MTVKNPKRIEISISLEDKYRVSQKAKRLGVSISKLMVMGALVYKGDCDDQH